MRQTQIELWAATAPEPQATLATAPHLGRPTPPEAVSKPIQPIQTTPARARGVASTGTEQPNIAGCHHGSSSASASA
eukprot:scaffold188201_cov36-Tisochrysis_lutea.AAC.1